MKMRRNVLYKSMIGMSLMLSLTMHVSATECPTMETIQRVEARDVLVLSESTYNGITYMLDDEEGQAIVASAVGVSGAIVIPAKINGNYQVVGIKDNAFSGNSNITSVEIPEGVTTIGGNAFGNCNALTQVYVPSTVTAIGSSAFVGCTNITIQFNHDANNIHAFTMGTGAVQNDRSVTLKFNEGFTNGIGSSLLAQLQSTYSNCTFDVSPADLSAAKTILENGIADCVIDQKDGGDVDALKDQLVLLANDILKKGHTGVVIGTDAITSISITQSPVSGDAGTPYGVDGSFTFAIKLNDAYSVNSQGVIRATPWSGIPKATSFIQVQGTLINEGTLSIGEKGTLTVEGTLNTSGTIDVAGRFYDQTGASYTGVNIIQPYGYTTAITS